MSIINNLLWSFATEIYEPSLCSMTEAVSHRMRDLKPDGAWADPASNSHELIQHLAFVSKNPDIYFPTKSAPMSIVGMLEECISIVAKSNVNS